MRRRHMSRPPSNRRTILDRSPELLLLFSDMLKLIVKSNRLVQTSDSLAIYMRPRPSQDHKCGALCCGSVFGAAICFCSRSRLGKLAKKGPVYDIAKCCSMIQSLVIGLFLACLARTDILSFSIFHVHVGEAGRPQATKSLIIRTSSVGCLHVINREKNH